MCIKLVSIKELYYDARPTKSKKKMYVRHHVKFEWSCRASQNITLYSLGI